MSGQNYDAPARPEANVAVPDDQAGALSKLSSQYMQSTEGGKTAAVNQAGQPGGDSKNFENSPSKAGGERNESSAKDGEGHRHDHMGMPPNEAERGEARSDQAKARRLEEKGLLPPGEGIIDHGKGGGFKHAAGLKGGESCVTTPTMESVTKTRDGTTIINSASTTVCRPTHEGIAQGHAYPNGSGARAFPMGRQAGEEVSTQGRPAEAVIQGKPIDKPN